MFIFRYLVTGSLRLPIVTRIHDSNTSTSPKLGPNSYSIPLKSKKLAKTLYCVRIHSPTLHGKMKLRTLNHMRRHMKEVHPYEYPGFQPQILKKFAGFLCEVKMGGV